MKSTLMKSVLGLLTLGSLGLTTGALASWNYGGHDVFAFRQSQLFSQEIDTRQDRQMDRIHAGRHEGRLTRAEFLHLMNEQDNIGTLERHFRAGGIIDAYEFRRLDHALDMAGRTIWAERHDAQERHAYHAAPWRN
jgi:hypothetical protein